MERKKDNLLKQIYEDFPKTLIQRTFLLTDDFPLNKEIEATRVSKVTCFSVDASFSRVSTFQRLVKFVKYN